MQTLDVGSNGSRIDDTVVDPDIVGFIDDDENGALFLNDLGFRRIRAIDVEPLLANERCRNDKEDQHDKDDVEHRCQVDLVVVLLLL